MLPARHNAPKSARSLAELRKRPWPPCRRRIIQPFYAKILCMETVGSARRGGASPGAATPYVATPGVAADMGGDPTAPASYPVDAAALRTLAHPLRSRLLAELRSLGPATATDLAASLDTNTGATSYHLRRLEDVGLVADTGTGRGRRRIWEARTDGREVWPEADDDADAAAEWLARDYVQHFAGRAQEWIGRAGEWSPTWQDATGLDDRLVLVTDDQLAALRAEVDEVLARYRRVGAGNPQAKRVTFYTCAFPVDPPGRHTARRRGA